MLLNYHLNQFKKLQVMAGSNLILFLSALNGLGVIYYLSWVAAVAIWNNMDTVTSPLIMELSIQIPQILLVGFSLLALDKITLVMILVNKIGQKLVFHAIQSIDLRYWRKNGSSPCANAIFALQQRFQQMSVYRKRQIIVVGAAVVAIWYLYKLEVLL